MISDTRERATALDPARSFIVQAPAGSGKTGLLVQRFLRLLATVEKPESVVAMTFTRKAAAELKERIHEALLAAQGHEEPVELSEYERTTKELARDVLKQDTRHGWNLLVDTSRLQIQTIDSLCAMLTRQMPVGSGFGGVAKVVEDASELYRMAARETLRELANGDTDDQALLARLGVYFDSDFVSLENQIIAMLARRDQWQFAADDSDAQVADFCRLLQHSEIALENAFQINRTVDFTAIAQAAIAVLGTPEQPTDLLYGLDYRIQHLLVDEFQDTSHSQYELINAITAQWSDGDGHTLFLVGDPMQSIYGFRGAEVGLFLKSWEDQALKSVRLHPVTLTTNFRCTPEILAWVQHHFEPIMSEDQGGGVRFRPSTAARDMGGSAPQLAALIEDKGGQTEATQVAECAQKAIKLGSVAILVRSRNHLISILPALQSCDLRYEAVEIARLAEQQHVEDLISLTRALLHVGDRVSWLACLRAPWCGLTLADLAALSENERDRTIVDLMREPDKVATLSEDGRWRLVRTGEILLAALERVGHVPLRSLLEDVWLLLGGPAILRSQYAAEDVQSYLDLIEEMERGGIIRDFSLLAQRLDVLFAKPATGEDYIQVMTIHQAKGLEFDTVIIPQLSGGARPTERDLLAWSEEIDADGHSVVRVAAQPRRGEKTEKYDSIRELQKAQEDHELKRLFYVGCTRAKNDLYLFGSARFNKAATELQKPWPGSFLRLIWETIAQEFTSASRRSPKQQSLFAEDAAPPARRTILRRLPATWQAPDLERPFEWQPQFRPSVASGKRVTYEWVSDTGRHVGTVTHALLKRAAMERREPPTSIVLAELRRLGVPEEEEAAATERTLRAVRNALNSERGQWILTSHAESRWECSVGGKVGQELISGTIDRLFRDHEGRLWIIDFKTSEHQGTRLEKFLDEEQRRYRDQLQSYATILARMESGPISLGLYFPLLDAWREWPFEEAHALVAH
jgi:ATP-dependent helicase/nuclease subunit A